MIQHYLLLLTDYPNQVYNDTYKPSPSVPPLILLIFVAFVLVVIFYIFYEIKQSKNISKSEDFTVANDWNWEVGRYTALKTIVGLVNTLVYLLVIVGVIVAFMFFSDESYKMGFMCLIGGVLFALPLLAFSNLIYVFVDIEYNTRKTREAVTEMNKQSKP